jgi:hypothetical protein
MVKYEDEEYRIQNPESRIQKPVARDQRSMNKDDVATEITEGTEGRGNND